MDSRLYACFIPLVGGVIDSGTGCDLGLAPGLRAKMIMRCDKEFEILADMSACFAQCRQVRLAMEGKADGNGWAAETSLCAHSRQG